MIDKQLAAILACPVCKGTVEVSEDWVTCAVCAKRYPIRDDIPIMLIDEAEDIVADSAAIEDRDK